jgi:hypothetical protein
LGSIALRNWVTPCFAFRRSSPLIEPVRSRITWTSKPFAEHGEQAVELAWTVIELRPRTRANHVGTTDFAETMMPFCLARVPMQPYCLRHVRLTVVTALSTVVTSFGLELPCAAGVVPHLFRGAPVRPQARPRRRPTGAGAARGMHARHPVQARRSRAARPREARSGPMPDRPDRQAS